ncbi:DUF4982 domain-containing protein [Aerococcaceae bacterium zg-BR9]|uniref:glycoside hydrolase family 2 TIM barrel-domain containing protein n=1 Tax=Aerococcaceae bacterium zg-1292 TaxID=2774330 RepID=UPI00406298E8|nr:DUF4982 domain-containing protein [Aerococcaceae bacterium zg-BR9]
MKKIDFSANWRYRRLDSKDVFQTIDVPHDAMFLESRTEDSMGGHNIGYFQGYNYEYEKDLVVTKEDKGKTFKLEFEGVYQQATIYINSEQLLFRPYGYTNFFVDITKKLKYGDTNTIRVTVKNDQQPNSRWYTGTGIYRPVHLYIGDEQYITENGVRIKTLAIDIPTIEVALQTVNASEAVIEIVDGQTLIDRKTVNISSDGTGVVIISLPHAHLWSADAPYLYQACVSVGTDVVVETFGIRQITWDTTQGLMINGQREILRGACVHHDNGPLGAAAFPEAEERKVRLMKLAGYNAIRSAHNPCSKALLEACDRLGMYVLDEYLDGWYIHKTEYDYALYIDEWWQQDLKDMVEKDYNHPCVIMYSTGNEVSETAQPRGIEFTKMMRDYLHQLDGTRPTTVGVNIFFNFLSSMGFGVYSDEKAKKEVNNKQNNKKAPVGSEFYNTLAGILGAHTMKIGATLYLCDVKTRDAFANMDIAGYNYGILRYKNDLKKYPNRLILGSETFASDAYKFWELAKEHPRIIGDFVWAGMDYMGETGVGAWVYPAYMPKGSPKSGWLTAGSGRVNLLGQLSAEVAYTRIAFELDEQPVIAVRPVHMKGMHSPSAWKMTDALFSWTYPGYEGETAEVEVYTRAEIVRLFINEKLIAVKCRKNDCRVLFKLSYQPGVLTAKTYDKKGNFLSETSLKTANAETIISLEPESKAIAGRLLYIQIRYTDECGNIKPTERGRIHVSVLGGELVALGHACSYNPDGFLKQFTDTYYGEAMAIVRVDSTDTLTIKAHDEHYTAKIELPIYKKVNEN